MKRHLHHTQLLFGIEIGEICIIPLHMPLVAGAIAVQMVHLLQRLIVQSCANPHRYSWIFYIRDRSWFGFFPRSTSIPPRYFMVNGLLWRILSIIVRKVKNKCMDSLWQLSSQILGVNWLRTGNLLAITPIFLHNPFLILANKQSISHLKRRDFLL